MKTTTMLYSIKKSLKMCLAMVLLFSQPVAIKPSSLKIHTSEPSNRFTRETEASRTACEDKKAVDRSSLNLTGPLSMLSERVRFFRSNYATENINEILSSEVVGLEMVSASTVFQTLKRKGCKVYIFGGMVRDQFLGVPSSDIDIAVSCSLETLLTLCRKEWGVAVCSTNTDLTIVHIGTPYHPLALDLASVEKDFYGLLTDLEYTANALAYDLNGLDVVLDITGHGVEDTCTQKIRIPSKDDPQSSLEAWSTPDRLYRYWKLRFKGFTTLDEATSDYIISEVKGLIEADTPRGLGFKQFYCRKVFPDSHYSHTENVCYKTGHACEIERDRAKLFDTLLTVDFGVEYVWSLALPACKFLGSTALTITLKIPQLS